MDAYSPFTNDPDELTELRRQNTLLHTELSSALQYIQGLHEALTEHFDGRNLSIMSQAERDLFDVWKLTSSKYPKRPDVITLLWDARRIVQDEPEVTEIERGLIIECWGSD